jgi:uncharacterized protein YaaW (UPF0174 family)
VSCFKRIKTKEILKEKHDTKNRKTLFFFFLLVRGWGRKFKNLRNRKKRKVDLKIVDKLGRDKLKIMPKTMLKNRSNLMLQNGSKNDVQKVGYKLLKLTLKFDPKTDFFLKLYLRHGEV